MNSIQKTAQSTAILKKTVFVFEAGNPWVVL